MNYIFGYGSIINDTSRLHTLNTSNSNNSLNPISPHKNINRLGGSIEGDNAVAAYLNPKFATRCWCFRSTTGFTALGLKICNIPNNIQQINDKKVGIRSNTGLMSSSNNLTLSIYNSEIENTKINGVLFPVTCSKSLVSFDVRENGYSRVRVPLDMIEIDTKRGSPIAQERASKLHATIQIQMRQSVDDSSTTISDDTVIIWTYIPDEYHLSYPSEEFPILQTYIDVCVRGCLLWGGEEYVQEFLLTIHNWNEFYLYDVPMGRRPWLHRPDYINIDACLEKVSDHIKFKERKHPEEFAASHLTALRGMWGVPPRNSKFIGREEIILHIHDKLMSKCTNDNILKGNLDKSFINEQESPSGICQVEIVGLGGVGKTQITTEYAHRYFGITFGLIAWLRSETSASLAADMRRLANDLGILKRSKNLDNNKKSNSTSNNEDSEDTYVEVEDEVVLEEVHRRLMRCPCRWLIIFDNVDNPETIASYIPRGIAQGTGHILVTSRLVSTDIYNQNSAIFLECFTPIESLRFLQICLDTYDDVNNFDTNKNFINNNENDNNFVIKHENNTNDFTKDDDYTKQLITITERMGHLPLALSVAAAYMNRCNVSPEEYIMRTDSLWRTNIHGPNASILSAVSVTLDRIKRESLAATHVLSCLGYLSSDNISKSLIRLLLIATHFKLDGPQDDIYYNKYNSNLSNIYSFKSLVILLSSVLTIIIGFLISTKKMYNVDINVSQILFVFISIGGYLYICYIYYYRVYLLERRVLRFKALGISCGEFNNKNIHYNKIQTMENCIENSLDILHLTTSNISNDELLSGVTDNVWDILRQFSLLSIRKSNNQRVGSIHRLQQSILRSMSIENSNLSSTLCIERCIWVLTKNWNYSPLKSSTWESSSMLLEHIQMIGKYTLEICSNHPFTGDNVSYEVGAVKEQPKMIRWVSGLNLGKLLTDAGSFAALVLSRYDTAQSLLQTAAKIHQLLSEFYIIYKNNFTRKLLTLDDIKELTINKATTLHNLGKIQRYLGYLEKSKFSLIIALKMRLKILPVSEAVAETLHELGVLFLKKHNMDRANKYLRRSLELKNELQEQLLLKNQNLNSNILLKSNDYAQAATLHQLAVVATANRNYDEAESLLHKALNLEIESIKNEFGGIREHELGSRITSRAATLQQLGRVAMRRGKLEEAEEQFHQALILYEKAYGSRRSACNVNVAAVKHQLGEAAAAAHKYDDACSYIREALKIREVLSNLHSENGKIDIVYELQALGKAELNRGNINIAEEIFKKGKSMIESLLTNSLKEKLNSNDHNYKDENIILLKTENLYNTNISSYFYNKKQQYIDLEYELDSEIIEIDAKSTVNIEVTRNINTLKKSLLFILQSLRQIMKIKGENETMLSLSKEIQILRVDIKPIITIESNHKSNDDLKLQSSNNNNNNNNNNSNNIDLKNPFIQCSLLIICTIRTDIKDICKKMLNQSHLLKIKKDIEKVIQNLEELEVNLSKNFTSFISTPSSIPLYDRKQIDIFLNEVSSSSSYFQSSVLKILYSFRYITEDYYHSNECKDLIDELFMACDNLRSDLRELGVPVDR